MANVFSLARSKYGISSLKSMTYHRTFSSLPSSSRVIESSSSIHRRQFLFDSINTTRGPKEIPQLISTSEFSTVRWFADRRRNDSRKPPTPFFKISLPHPAPHSGSSSGLFRVLALFGASAFILILIAVGFVLAFPIADKFFLPYAVEKAIMSKKRGVGTSGDTNSVLPPFFVGGRDEELNQLEELSYLSPRIVFVRGRQEVGKSTLLRELIDSGRVPGLYINLRQWTTLEHYYMDLLESLYQPLGFWGQVLHSYFKMWNAGVNVTIVNNGQEHQLMLTFKEVLTYLHKSLLNLRHKRRDELDSGKGSYPIIVLDELQSLIDAAESPNPTVTRDLSLNILRALTQLAHEMVQDERSCHFVLVGITPETLSQYLPGTDAKSDIILVGDLKEAAAVEFLKARVHDDRRSLVTNILPSIAQETGGEISSLKRVLDAINRGTLKGSNERALQAVAALREEAAETVKLALASKESSFVSRAIRSSQVREQLQSQVEKLFILDPTRRTFLSSQMGGVWPSGALFQLATSIQRDHPRLSADTLKIDETDLNRLSNAGLVDFGVGSGLTFCGRRPLHTWDLYLRPMIRQALLTTPLESPVLSILLRKVHEKEFVLGELTEMTMEELQRVARAVGFESSVLFKIASTGRIIKSQDDLLRLHHLEEVVVSPSDSKATKGSTLFSSPIVREIELVPPHV